MVSRIMMSKRTHKQFCINVHFYRQWLAKSCLGKFELSRAFGKILISEGVL